MTVPSNRCAYCGSFVDLTAPHTGERVAEVVEAARHWRRVRRYFRHGVPSVGQGLQDVTETEDALAAALDALDAPAKEQP